MRRDGVWSLAACGLWEKLLMAPASSMRHWVDGADSLWEGNTRRSGSVGGEHKVILVGLRLRTV